ncbi:Fibrinogen-like protein 1,Fibrinogen-like protein A,Ficolin-1-B,Ficolin-1-A,Ficolin-2,Tenascin-R,Ficolin-1,Fibrinogen C domain-containing protein 1 [Mytilus coruscus]|uniref:Fibrinogen-like protein 1,Fibrinogen-like protein A,Ficolin-1-B,Ficolin-1-A,Ficolin-2,Tenascin-R,Ficolin-1,Fi brinogen C domain-containing protein 1 n=1 Tax=Mytilus coruscus TaxID=42192 RepID=A0A6J8A0C3_MYTCO|nr:Fibrinogen-like protein 1,Fibrinogen-like protein A,Ficolin-1-B,Ficolin-1-A,Ficolin-2,Tenascin-R,Ficolin-1,Fibrinogen C domain-containing protein 1 [Mytilus coruscus]
MINTLFLFLNALIILMVAIYVNHTERLILQLKEDVRKSLQLERVSEEKPIDCTDIHVSEGSGIYTIYPKGIGRINVYCDLDTYNIGGGWTVFQHRETGEEDFNREWIDYENGFGNLRKEFWLGNSNLYIITDQGRYELMVMIEDFKNNKAFARYTSFKIGNVFSNYKLSIGEYSGTAGNSLWNNNNKPFTTWDKHNIKFDTEECEKYEEGPWWFFEHRRCTVGNLNGKYLKEKSGDYGGIYWYHWQTSYKVTLQKTTMMIRRIL